MVSKSYILDAMVIVDALNQEHRVLEFLSRADQERWALFLSSAVEFEILVGFHLHPNREHEEGFRQLSSFLRPLPVEREDWQSAANTWGMKAAEELGRTKDAEKRKQLKRKYKRLKIDYLVAAQGNRTSSTIVTRDKKLGRIASSVHTL